MRNFYAKFIFAVAFVLFAFVAKSQVTVTVTNPGNTTPNLAANYSSLSAALAGLNAVTAMSGPVVFTCDAGGSETAPPAGFTIGSATLNPVLSATNAVTIQKAGGTVTLNAGTGAFTPASATPDGILKIVGADYITIDGLTLTDGNTTNPETMEFGIGLFKFSASDGAQNNTIRNCIISLSRNNFATGTAPMIEGSVGILVINSIPTAATTAIVPSAASGANSNNNFFANDIQNVNHGIALSGYAAPSPFTLGDANNNIGGSSLAQGNTILNFGGGTAATNAAAGIRANNQWGINISYNTVNNNNGAGVNHENVLRGIYAQAGTSASATITFNTVTVHGGGTTHLVYGIDNGIGSTAASNSININNNNVTGDYATATTATFYGIFSSASAATVNVLNNNVHDMSRIATTSGTTIGIYTSAGAIQNVSNNTVNNFSVDGTGTGGILYGIQTSTGTVVCDNNTVTNLNVLKASSTSALYGIYNISSPTNENYNYNTVRTLNHAGTGTTYGIFANTISGTRTMSFNNVSALTTGGLTIAGINNTTSSPNIFNNKIYDISSSSIAAPTVSGLIQGSVGTAGTSNIYNNIIGDIRAENASSTAATAPSVRGINITTATASSFVNVSFNTIYLNASSTGANFATAGLFVTSSATATVANLTLKNNIFVNTSTPAGVGHAVAYQRSSNSLANYNSSSNNNLFYAGAPSVNNVIFYDGTTADVILADYKSRVAPADASSVTENVPFASTNGPDANYLHINVSTPTKTESGGTPVAGITKDFDEETRNVSTPDIGADEFNGTVTVSMVYNSATAVQVTGTAYTKPAQEIIGIEIMTTNSASPLLATQFVVNANGTTNIADLINAKIYFTGASATFNTNNLFGTATPSISNFTITGSQALVEGINHFWLAYDVSTSAASGNVIDGELINLTVDGIVRTPTVTAPAGNKTIVGPMNGNYNVGAGLTTPNFVTITAALQDLENRGISGPVSFTLTNSSATPYNVANGETFPLVINEITGAGPNTVTFKPAAGIDALITGSSATGTALIKLNGADYIVFDGLKTGGSSLTIENTSILANTAVIWVSSLGAGAGATNNTIKNMVIRAGSSTATSVFGIIASGTTISTTGTGESNDNLTIQNNNIEKAYYGISSLGVASTGVTDNLSIMQNNIGSDVPANTIGNRGIKIGNATGANISGNRIFNFSNSSTTIQTTGIEVSTNTVSSVISKNEIYNLEYTGTANRAGQGISISTVAAADIEVSNNMIYSLKGHSSTTASNNSWGVMVLSGGGIKMYYNSISVSETFRGTATYIHGGIYLASGLTNISIVNNIISNTASFGVFYNVYSLSANTAFTSIDYNDYYTNGASNNVGFLTSARPTLANWQTATGQDANSKNVDPNFISNTNLHINTVTPSYIESAGTPIAGITSDFDDDVRNVSTPDLGADEGNFVVPLANDLQATAFIDPASGGTKSAGIAFYPIASFTNNGSASQTNVTVRYRIVGPLPGGTEVYNQTATISSINSLATTQVTFPAATVSAAGTYTIYARSELVGDVVGANDEITTTLVIETPLCGAYSIGASQPAGYQNLTQAISKINTVGISCPVTFELQADYSSAGETFPLVMNEINGTSAANTLTIKPAAGVAASISGTSGTTVSSLIKIDGTDYVVFDGLNTGGASLTLENTSVTTGTAVLWISSKGVDAGASNITIRNTAIKGGANQNSGSVVTYGVVIAGATISATATSIAAGNDNDNILIENNLFTKLRYAVFSRGGSTTNPNTGTVIRNNTFGPAAGFGADAIGKAAVIAREEDGIQVTGNTIQFVGGDYTNTTAGTDRVAIGFGTDASWISTTAPTAVMVRNAVVTKNVIHDVVDERTFSAVAIVLSVIDGTNPTNNLIANNFIYNVKANGTSGDQTGGIATSSSNSDRIVHNTIYLTGDIDPNALASTPTTSANGINLSTTAVTNLMLANNIVYMDLTSSSAPALKFAAINIPNSFSWGTGSSDYNDFYVNASNPHSNTGSMGSTAGTFSPTLADWRTASSQDANSVDLEPFFVSATDLHIDPLNPGNSGFDNLGTPIAGITTDIDNETRSATTPDLGADEFTLSSLVPITIEYFRGAKQNNGNYISWKVNCVSSPSAILILERSADGRNFKVVSREDVTALRCKTPFSYKDADALPGLNYYRLKMIDADGVVTYSNIVALLNKEKGYEIVGLAPNPVVNTTVLQLSSAVAGVAEIMISDVTGKVAMKQKVTLIAGSNQLQLNLANFASGTYQVTVVTNEGNKKSLRFVKQ